jgi:hypothetical protein
LWPLGVVLSLPGNHSLQNRKSSPRDASVSAFAKMYFSLPQCYFGYFVTAIDLRKSDKL